MRRPRVHQGAEHDLASAGAVLFPAVEDRIGVASLPDWCPPAFHMPAGEVTGYIERLSWTAAKAPAEFSRTWYDASRANYISRMGKG